MNQREELRSIIEFVTEQLDAKWAILVTHDEANNVIAAHNADCKSIHFVRNLESKMFEAFECIDIGEAEA